MKNEAERTIYLIMEANYLKENNRKLEDNNSDMFPAVWYSSSNYKLKSEILYEAITNKKKIIETEKYQDLIEGIKKN